MWSFFRVGVGVVLLGACAAQRIDCRPFHWDNWGGSYEISGLEHDARDVKNERSFKEQCEARGCTYDENLESNNPNREPPCYFSNTNQYRWKTTSTDVNEEYQLQYYFLENDEAEYFPDYDPAYAYPGPVRKLTLTAHHESPHRLRVKIEDTEKPRYQVPAPYGRLQSPTGDPYDDPLYRFVMAERESNFFFRVTRENGINIFDTDLPGQVYEDQFLQLSTKLPSTYIYGFGETERDSWTHQFDIYKRQAMFTRPQGVGVGLHLYGHHPFYMGLDPVSAGSWAAYGVFWLNSNAQEIDFIPDPPALTFRSIGGIFDFYFFLGPKPEDVIMQFTTAIGKPYLVPYWSLGFHTCQYYYGSLEVINEMYERMVEAEIPWDVIQHDIDYMERQMDFTVDAINYDGMKEWDEDRQAEGFRIVVMLDPALTFGDRPDYAPSGGCCSDYDPDTGVCGGSSCTVPYPSVDTGFDMEVWVKLSVQERDSGYDQNQNTGPRGNYISLPVAGYPPLPVEDLFDLPTVPLEGKVWPDWPNITLSNTDVPTDSYPPGCATCAEKSNTWNLCHDADSFGWNDQVKYCRAPLGFPDFFNEVTQQWWKDHLREFIRNQIPIDAIWIDMNEPENFIHGSYNYLDDDHWISSEPGGHFTREGGSCPNTRYDFPPYHLRDGGTFNNGMFTKTLCMSSIHNVHYLPEVHYNVHSIYGAFYSIPTWEAIREEKNLRAFVFSRSTFPGVGQYIGHWLGDNWSGWPPLKYSIVGQLDFNLFGIPFVGADVCGFFNDVTDDLCMRWTQLGAFYGFWRNHNTKHARWQDPAAFSPEFSAAAKKVHEKRYALIPYIYTLFYHAHVKGTTVSRSMMHEFINVDSNPLIFTIDTQFMMGSGLMISPAVESHMVDDEERALPEVSVYLPSGGRWYDRENGREFTAGFTHTVQVPLYDYNYGVVRRPEENDCKEDDPPCYVIEDIPLHFRGGVVIPEQLPANRTFFSRMNKFVLHVPLDSNYGAKGDLFWDDGESKETVETGQYSYVEFEVFQGELEVEPEMMVEGLWTFITPVRKHESAESLMIKEILYYGLDQNFTRANMYMRYQERLYILDTERWWTNTTDADSFAGVSLEESRSLTLDLHEKTWNIPIQEKLVLLWTDAEGLHETGSGYLPSVSIAAISVIASLCLLGY